MTQKCCEMEKKEWNNRSSEVNLQIKTNDSKENITCRKKENYYEWFSVAFTSFCYIYIISFCFEFISINLGWNAKEGIQLLSRTSFQNLELTVKSNNISDYNSSEVIDEEFLINRNRGKYLAPKKVKELIPH